MHYDVIYSLGLRKLYNPQMAPNIPDATLSPPTASQRHPNGPQGPQQPQMVNLVTFLAVLHSIDKCTQNI